MNISIIVFFILVSIGLYLVLADIFNIASLKASKVILDINKREKKKSTKSFEAILLDYAISMSKFVSIDEYKRCKLEINLKSADIKISPETYLCQAYIKTGLMFLVGFILSIISPIVSIIFVFLAINVYVVELKKPEKLIRKKRNSIEHELPRFAMTIEQELQYSRDVFMILERYQKNSKSTLGKELEITIADMVSGSYEEALIRFEARIGSTSLSEVVRGLMSIINGSDETLYFRVLANKLKELEFQRLRGIALKRPQKIKKYSAMMMGCLMLIYAVVFGYEIITGINKLF